VAFGAVTSYGWMPGPTLEFFGPGGPGAVGLAGALVGGIGGIGFGGWTGPGPYTGYYPDDFDPRTKSVVSVILDALGRGTYEQGVLDSPQPSVPVVLHPEILTRVPTIPDEEPEFVGIYEAQETPQDWDEFYRRYCELNPEDCMAHDWGHLVRQGIESIAGLGVPQQAQILPALPPTVGGGTFSYPAGVPSITPSGGVMSNALCPPTGSCGGPRYLTYDCRTGTMSVRRRRRRRALLTEGDKRDLGVIVAMFGKGAAAQIALAAAVKR